MLEDFRLKVFLAVVENGSFTKAATQLGISQPAVSQNVAELERMLGGELFERTYGSISLTPKGEVFKNNALGIVKAYDSINNLFLNHEYAIVRYSASEEVQKIFLEPLFASYKAANPNIDFIPTKDENADLQVFLQPASNLPFETHPNAVLRIRLSVSPSPFSFEEGDAVKETSSYYDLIFQPSEDFAAKELFLRLKEYIFMTNGH